MGWRRTPQVKPSQGDRRCARPHRRGPRLGLLAAMIGGAAVVALLGLRSTSRAGSVETHVLGSERDGHSLH